MTIEPAMTPDCGSSRLAAVVVSWNTRDLLAECLTALARVEPAVEIVVVDNASADGTAAMVRSRFPAVRLIANDANLGFGRACNLGVAATAAPYVAVLNADLTVDPTTLPGLVAALDATPTAAIAAPRLLERDGALVHSCSRLPSVGDELCRLLKLEWLRPRRPYRMSSWGLDRPRRVEVVEGACIVARRGAFEEVGGFDERFFMYSEEVDLCRRVAEAGWDVIWVPTATATHLGGASSSQAADRMFLELYRAKLLYFRKHGGTGAARRYKAVLAVAAGARALACPVAATLLGGESRSRYRRLGSRYRSLLQALPGL